MLRLHDHRGQSSNAPYTYQGSHNSYLQYAASAAQTGSGGAGALSRAWRPRRLGIVPTLSVSEYPPYMLARLVNSLDHTTEGRIGWNCVTGSNDGAAQNYGHEKHRPHDERYDVADEFTDVVTKLWEAVGAPMWSCSTARSRCPRRRLEGPSHQSRRQVFQGARADQRAALAAGEGAGLPGRRFTARPAVRVALGRHHHHRGRRQRRKLHEGLSRQGP